MRRGLLVSVVGIGLACGGGGGVSESAEAPVEPVDGEANRPPYVETLAIVPSRPTAEDALTAGLRVIDPDRDPLSVELTWYRNGSVHDDSGRQSIDPREFARDDSVWVEALISDGKEQIEVRSESVSIANALPRAAAIRITPPEASAADMLEVGVEGDDADGDPVRWSYRWLIDDKPVEGAQTSRLAPGAFKRGARVAVEVSGNDGIDDGEWSASEAVVIGNAGPKVITQPVYGLASPGRYVYEVKAEDADGDRPLRFELTQGPSGMSIDLISGVVTWLVPPDAKGSYPVQIEVSDPYGGRAVQRYALEVSWKAKPERRAPRRTRATARSTDDDSPADEDAEFEDEDSDAEDAPASRSSGEDDPGEDGDF